MPRRSDKTWVPLVAAGVAVIATILIVGTRPPPRALPVYFPSVRLPGRRKEDEMPMAPGMLTRQGAPEGKSGLGLKAQMTRSPLKGPAPPASTYGSGFRFVDGVNRP